MAIKFKSNSAYDGQLQETNTAARQYYLPDNDSGLGTRLMTAQATTSGTSVLFSSIPSWVKRLTVLFNAVSGSGTSNFLIQLGSGSVTSSGYNATATAGATAVNNTAGFIVTATVTAATAMSGVIQIATLGNNIWVAGGSLAYSNGSVGSHSGGVVTLSGSLDRLNLTTANGTDTFDSGSVSVMYE